MVHNTQIALLLFKSVIIRLSDQLEIFVIFVHAFEIPCKARDCENVTHTQEG